MRAAIPLPLGVDSGHLSASNPQSGGAPTTTSSIFESITSDVYVRVSPQAGGANTGFVRTTDGLILIDSSSSPARSRRDLEGIGAVTGQPPSCLVLTHHHSDHWFGAEVFACEVLSTEATARQMRRGGEAYLSESRRHHPHLREELAAVHLRYPDRTFSGRLRIADVPPVDLLQLDGHADGLCVVHLPDQRIVFTSDLVFNGIHPYLRGSDLEGWLRGLDRLQDLDPRVVVPGHGPVSDGRQIRVQKAYLQSFCRAIARLKQEGVTKEQAASNLDLMDLPDLHRPRRLAAAVRFHWDLVTHC